MNVLLFSIVTGTGATLVMDIWTVIRKRVLGIAQPNYSFLGRWLAWMTRGRFAHESIAATPAVRGEGLIGWVAHYLIGIIFAALLILAFSPTWIESPTIAPAMLIGIGTVAAPFFLMQPGMGAGIAAARTPRPWSTRFHSLTTHAIFGVGLYVAGSAASLVHSLRA